MKQIIEKLNTIFPDAAKLLLGSTSPDFRVPEELGVPNDYFEMYKIVDGELVESDGVFGLNRMLTLQESISGIVKDVNELQCYSDGTIASIFVPIFQSPGRQQLGYAKFGDRWVFSELDLGLSSWPQSTLTYFLNWFKEKLDADGFFEDEDFKGLIDKDEAD